MIIQSHRPEGAQYPTIIVTVETEEEAEAMVSIAKQIYPTHPHQNMPHYLHDKQFHVDNATLRRTAREIHQYLVESYRSLEPK